MTKKLDEPSVRLSLSVPAKANKVLSRLSELTSTPKSQIIVELIVDALPVFVQVLEAVEQAKQGQKELAVQTMAGFLEKATVSLNQAQMEFGDLSNEMLGKK